MKNDFNIKLDDIAKWGIDIISLAGYGKSSIINMDRNNNRMLVRMENSTIAESYGNVGRCVDHMMRGYLAGAGVLYFGVETDCVETKCKSKGDKICEFIVKKREEFDPNNEQVKKQLSDIT
jgi:predicted hydrocarbon binding protein